MLHVAPRAISKRNGGSKSTENKHFNENMIFFEVVKVYSTEKKRTGKKRVNDGREFPWGRPDSFLPDTSKWISPGCKKKKVRWEKRNTSVHDEKVTVNTEMWTC